jgi:hypothetical protein
MTESKDTILSRKKWHMDTKHREKTYTLRLIAGNFLDLTTGGATNLPGIQPDGTWPDVEVFDWENGRHNPISTATQINAKSITFNAPDLSWDGIPSDHADTISLIRKEWFLHYYEKLDLKWAYEQIVLDAIISGEATLLAGVRDNDVFLEYCDAKYVTWDPVYKETYRKRFVWIDKCLPLSDAIKQYPKLEKLFPAVQSSQLESTVVITCYFSATTRAVLYGSEFIADPAPNPYGRIPACRMALFQMPGFIHPQGMVENQIGTYLLDVQLQRYFREVALRGASPVGVAKGNIEEGSLDEIMSGEECAIVRFSENGDFNWRPGAEISQTALKVWEEVQQLGNSESGINAFQQNRTDVKVDFASQLNYLAAQSGIQSNSTVRQLEDTIKDSVNLLMDVGSKFAPSISLSIGDTIIKFDSDTDPISSQLGSDGKLILKPNSTEFKSAAQKLQEVAMFGNVIAQASALPPGIQLQFIKQAIDSYELEDKDAWIEAIKKGQEQAAQMAQMQAQQVNPSPAPGPQGPPAL